MRLEYENPMVDITYFQTEDIITTSDPFFGGGEMPQE